MPKFTERLTHAWNAFTGRDLLQNGDSRYSGSSYRPDRKRLSRGHDRTIITTVYNRIAIDCAAVGFHHVQQDDNGRYVNDMDSGLNYCLTIEANVDQTGRSFIQDVVMSMFDEGCVAIVPTHTTSSPVNSNSYDVEEMRVGKIIAWYPQHVRVEVYNEMTGKKQELVLPKKTVAIVENPLYAIMNEPNSVLQRLLRKLTLLDEVDEATSIGKLDMIIQLPYVIKTEARRQQAEQRRKDIEMQLSGSRYGIAYTDGTERITQLNRSLDNNLMSQIEYLTSTLYSQLGLTTSILDGSADDKVMLNYHNRTIEPILSAISDEMKRKFLSKNARSRHQSIVFIRDPFRLVPVADLADIADKFTRNEILSSNEVRQLVGMKPVDSPQADELRNKNINAGEGQQFASTEGGEVAADSGGYDTQTPESAEETDIFSMPIGELMKE